MKKTIVSFDFDGTIGHRLDIQNYCLELLLRDNIDVWITTRRYEENIGKLSKNEQPDEYWWNSIGDKNWIEVWELASKLGIKRSNIIFCNMNNKVNFLKDQDFLWHLDDDSLEVEMINESEVTNGICLKDPGWKEYCDYLINEIK